MVTKSSFGFQLYLNAFFILFFIFLGIFIPLQIKNVTDEDSLRIIFGVVLCFGFAIGMSYFLLKKCRFITVDKSGVLIHSILSPKIVIDANAIQSIDLEYRESLGMMSPYSLNLSIHIVTTT